MLTLVQLHERALPVKPNKHGNDDHLYQAVGLGGEVGEVQNVVKKIARDGMTDELLDKLLDESGDVLFYLRQLLDIYGLTLDQAGEHLLEKLERIRAAL